MGYLEYALSTGSPGAYRRGITEWPTPWWLVDQLAAEFGPFDLDPAATTENAKAPAYFTVDVDGLAQPWHGRVFCNPPYGKTSTPRWLAKARSEVDCGNAELACCLVPARVSTRWWREYDADPAVFVRVIGRIRWDLARRGEAPFDSAVIVFGATGRHGTRPAKCPVCRSTFWPARSDHKACSRRCRRALARDQQAALTRPRKERS